MNRDFVHLTFSVSCFAFAFCLETTEIFTFQFPNCRNGMRSILVVVTGKGEIIQSKVTILMEDS